MDRAMAMGQLPEAYARLLRLHEQGLTDPELAARLEVPVEAVGVLLRLAEAKLARLLEQPPR